MRRKRKTEDSNMKNILFASSECVPFIKTGGLADVVGSLPKDFDKEKYDVRVVIPKYMCMKQEWKEKLEYITNFYMDIAGQSQYVGIFRLVHDGVTFYFIDNEHYFSGFAPYDGDPKWNIEKFAFFSKAVLSILPVIGFRPELIHCHDWQTGLIPVYLDNFRYLGEYYRGIKTVMTIHNLKFQGVWDTKAVQKITGLPDYYFAPDKMEAYKDANLLKGGIVYADKVTTVSRSYAEEIKTSFYGEGLEGLMNARANDLWGIVNGLDYNDWNPDTDYRLAKNFNISNFRRNKPANKMALLQGWKTLHSLFHLPMESSVIAGRYQQSLFIRPPYRSIHNLSGAATSEPFRNHTHGCFKRGKASVLQQMGRHLCYRLADRKNE